jgi:hypothetical protein
VANRWRQREAIGDMIIVRYAGVSAGFEHKADARRFLDAMRARFAGFALSLHPDKTRLIEFGRHAVADRQRRGLGKPESFDFLGFTHICCKSRWGRFLLMRKSRRDRLRVKLQAVREELRTRMHQPIRAGTVAEAVGRRLLQLSRRADQQSHPGGFSATM